MFGRRRTPSPWPEMGGVEWLSPTVVHAADEAAGRDAAEVLLERALWLCESERVNFEDPDFGPRLSDHGQQLADDFLQMLQDELSPAAFQDVARGVERRQKRSQEGRRRGGPGGARGSQGGRGGGGGAAAPAAPSRPAAAPSTRHPPHCALRPDHAD